MAIARAWILGLVALGVWFLCLWANEPHGEILPVTACASCFSVRNAEHVLARVLGPEKPHPVSSAENAAVRGRILKELTALGVPARTYQAFTCNPWRGLSFVACATVTDIVADVVPGQGKAIVMLAHYDSVPAGPGASDDESGVATILETVRALKAAGGASRHPVMALITDGEEAGLLGANAFLQNPALRARVGAVVNVEARGTRGPSLLFQTSPGDGRLIDLYAAHAPVMATSSLYAEIYKFLPNDTDLTLFIRDGFPSFNFAFADNVRYYHSPRDRRAMLSRATLKMHGDNLLGVVRRLEETDFAALKGGNDVYLSVLGLWLPRIPASWALPLSILAFIALAFAAWRTRGEERTWRRLLAAAVLPLALLLGCAALGFVLAFLAQAISGSPDPTYAYPLAMRIALGLGAWGMTLLVSRMTDLHGAAASGWLWLAGLAIVTAALLPGLSPYFLFPALVASVLLTAAAFAPGGWSGTAGQAALFLSALAALLVWFPLVASGETLMGLRLHPLFTVPAAFGLMTVVPPIATRPMSRRAWSFGAAASLAVALLGAIVAGLLPSYSAASPQRLNLIYFQGERGPARWIAETSWKAKVTERIPPSLQKAGNFKLDPDAYAGFQTGDGYVAPARAPRYPLPIATVAIDRRTNGTRAVTVQLHGTTDADAMLLRIPKDAGLVSLDLRGQHLT
ncbi:MAG TPA: M20/M25/M40 family metallo-hydrolase, partial [Rhizomicrobium sp.]